MNKLIVNALSKLLMTVAALGLLLFLPAGTFNYPGAWRLIGMLCGAMSILCIVLFIYDRELLRKRLDSWEKQTEQKWVVILSAVMFIAVFLVAALDFRYGWSNMPDWLVTGGCVLFLASYAGFGEVMRENSFLSRTVEVQEDQKVVDTGLYGVVRHPMYSVITLMYISMPLVLGSCWALLPLVFFPPIIVVRILGEERVLTAELKGYREYKDKVRYRLFPGIF
ncbi:MAG: methyltransferase family protein [Candidatus Cryptobacteroides sp.]